MAARNGRRRRYAHIRVPAPPPADWTLGERERYVLAVFADVAAVQLQALPERSLVRRLLEVPISELDHWGSDPAFGTRPLGYGPAPRPGSLEARFGEQIVEMRRAGRSQTQIAKLLGCSPSRISRIESKLNGASWSSH